MLPCHTSPCFSYLADGTIDCRRETHCPGLGGWRFPSAADWSRISSLWGGRVKAQSPRFMKATLSKLCPSSPFLVHPISNIFQLQNSYWGSQLQGGCVKSCNSFTSPTPCLSQKILHGRIWDPKPVPEECWWWWEWRWGLYLSAGNRGTTHFTRNSSEGIGMPGNLGWMLLAPRTVVRLVSKNKVGRLQQSIQLISDPQTGPRKFRKESQRITGMEQMFLCRSMLSFIIDGGLCSFHHHAWVPIVGHTLCGMLREQGTCKAPLQRVQESPNRSTWQSFRRALGFKKWSPNIGWCSIVYICVCTVYIYNVYNNIYIYYVYIYI